MASFTCENESLQQDVTMKEDAAQALEDLKKKVNEMHNKMSITHGFNQDVAKEEDVEKLLKNLNEELKAEHMSVDLPQVSLDVTKKAEDEKVVENQTILSRTAPQRSVKKDFRKKVLEYHKYKLKFKHVRAYSVSLILLARIFEWDKISFGRAMEKAWFINSIIMERCLQSGGDYKEIEKVMYFNKKLKRVITAGLDGILFGPSDKRKVSSSSSHEASDKEELELVKNCKEMILQMVPPEDGEKFENCCRCAPPFKKQNLQSCEEHLESIINSLLEREKESEREVTENEILGYMLLQEIAKSTLQFPCILFPPKLPNSITGDGYQQRDEKIVVQINKQLFTEQANARSNFKTSWASNYYALLMKAKAASNNSNSMVEQIQQMLPMVEELIPGIKECLLMYQKYQRKLVAGRRSETKLFEYCEDLSFYVRLGMCLNPVFETTSRLKKIICLTSHAIDRFTQANGPDSLPTITQPFLPTWRQLIN